MTKTTRRVGRPSQTSRAAILAAASELLEADGLPGLSLRKLAKQLEISPTSLYRYFENKQQLLTALGEQVLDLDGVSLPASASPEQQLEILLNQLRRQVLRFPGLLAQFNTALPAEAMVNAITRLSKPLLQAGVEPGLAVRHAQSLLWMSLSFALFETASGRAEVGKRFSKLPVEAQATARLLELDDYQRLWRETLARNLAGLGLGRR